MSKLPRVKTRGFLEFKQSLSATADNFIYGLKPVVLRWKNKRDCMSIGEAMEKKATCIQVSTLIIVVLSWFAIPWMTEYNRKQAEIGIWQHVAMSDAHRNIATAINGLHAYTTELASRYNCGINDVLSKMTEKELSKANCFVEQMNTELVIMYMIMPNDKYKEIRDAVKLKQDINLIEYRNNLLVAMRKSQVPDATYVTNEDIRSFDYLKKPIKKATD